MSATDLFDLSGKDILLTGGSGLLGSHWVSVLESFGARVFNLDRIQPEDASKGIHIWGDLSSWSTVETALQELEYRYGTSIYGIVNAAFYNPGPTTEIDHRNWRLQSELMEGTDRLVAWGLTKESVQVVINIGSDLSLQGITPYLYEGYDMKQSHYTIFKHAMLGLTHHWAPLYAYVGKRMNLLCPGGVGKSMPEEFRKRVEKLVPMGRTANVSDFDGALIFLLSNASRYMTGTTLVIDGGRTCW